jgi:hypothetical protein
VSISAPAPRESALAAVSRSTRAEPAATSASAHAAAVAPVVSTSSTSRTLGGGDPRTRKRPSIAASRSSRPRRAWGPASLVRLRNPVAGTARHRPTISASRRAWSNPRSARRRRDSGTQLTASTVEPSGTPARHVEAIAEPSGSATRLHPENFSRCTAARTGPSNKKAARATPMGSGGQSPHERVSRPLGAAHRRQQGDPSGTICSMHLRQKGHAPSPHPAHRGGYRTSSRARSTRRPYPPPPTGDGPPQGSRTSSEPSPPLLRLLNSKRSTS